MQTGRGSLILPTVGCCDRETEWLKINHVDVFLFVRDLPGGRLVDHEVRTSDFFDQKFNLLRLADVISSCATKRQTMFGFRVRQQSPKIDGKCSLY